LDSVTGRAIHGLFLKILRNGSKKIADECHKEMSIKPFTVSPLLGSFGRTSTNKLIVKEFEYWARFTFLNEEIFQAFSKVIFPMAVEQAQIFLGEQSFRITRTALEASSRNRWSDLTTYKQIKKEAEEVIAERSHETNFSLNFSFYSPTAFRRGSIGIKDSSFLLPEPALVYKSLIKKWNTFSGTPIKPDLTEKIAGKVFVSAYRLHTELYDLGNVTLQGFKGKCTFILLDSDKELTSDLLTLSKFSFFAGIGQKTTMGMGQARLANTL
jgi:CRISPR-associated endoribonuclease Cas6